MTSDACLHPAGPLETTLRLADDLLVRAFDVHLATIERTEDPRNPQARLTYIVVDPLRGQSTFQLASSWGGASKVWRTTQ